MSSDNGHDKDHAAGHDSHDDHPVATDIIPENSPQDLLLKVITVVFGVFLLSGSFIWWWSQPLAVEAGEHGGAESTQH